MSKVVLITGTSTGLGLKIAVSMSQKGYQVYASMRNTDKKDMLLQEAEAAGTDLQVVQLDVCDTSSINKCVDSIIEKEGRIDVLINNAGAGFAKNVEQATEQEISWITDVNYHNVVYCTKAVLPHMRKQKSGHIVNISSVGGLVGQPFNEMYCAAKFAVEGFTEALATYVPQNFGVNFSIVEPGGIATEFANSALKKMSENGGIPQDEYAPVFQQYVSGIQNRSESEQAATYQTPQQVADVVMAVVENEKPPLRIRTSEWAENLCELKTQADPDGTKQTQKVRDMFLS
ncbi:MAG: SDR family oxidoreductase [Bacteroidota bacterium]